MALDHALLDRIVDTAHRETTEALTDHRANLDSLVSELLAHETLDQAEAYRAAGLPINIEAESEETPPISAVLSATDGDGESSAE